VEVGAERSGPFETDGGKLEAPIVVSPGDTHARVIATDDFGNERTEEVNLRPPARSRLALVAPHQTVPLNAETHIAIAYAHIDGTPGTDRATIAIEAQRGVAGSAAYRGNGLWVASYRAPTDAGAETVTVRVTDAGKESAATLELTAVLPAVASIDLSFPEVDHVAGSTLVGRIVVGDANGYAITSIPPTLRNGDQNVDVRSAEDGFTFALALPTAAGSSITLTATAGEARSESRVNIVSGAPSSAEIDVRLAGRSAQLTVRVLDAHGNPVSPDSYQLRAEGAALSSETPGAARLDAEADVATISLLAGDIVIAEREVRFPPDRAHLEVGLRALGGYWTNTGVLSGPRVSLWAGLRRDVGPVELALLVGAEYSRATHVARAGDMRVNHTVDVLAVPLDARVRYGVTGDVGVSVGLVVAPTAVRTTSTSPDVPNESTAGIRGAVRGVLGGDFTLGPGRVVAQLSLGHATLPDDGFLTGTVERFAVVVGYETWLFDLLD